MRKTVVIVVAATAALTLSGPAVAAQSAKVAALQVALRSKRLYAGPIDGISGPLTRSSLITFQTRHGIRATGKVGYATRCQFGKLGGRSSASGCSPAAGSAGTSPRSSSACGRSACPRGESTGASMPPPPRHCVGTSARAA